MYLYLNLYLLRMRSAAVLRRNGRIRSYSPPPSPLRPLHCSFKTILNSSRQLFGDKIHKTAPAHAVLKVVPGLKKRSTPKSMLFVMILVSQFQKVWFLNHSLGSEGENGPKNPQKAKNGSKISLRIYIAPELPLLWGSVFFTFLLWSLLD